MFPRRFATRFRLTILLSVIPLVSCTTCINAIAQIQQLQSTTDRLESPAERRLREHLKQNRTMLVGESGERGTKSRLERRLRQQLNERRSDSSARQKPKNSVVSNASATARNVQQFGRIELTDPSESRLAGRAEPWNLNASSQKTDEVSLGGPNLGSLESFEKMAIENNPTLNAAVAKILTARHEALQAGLHPNPQLGLFIDELGNDNDPGIWGGYLQGNVVRGNKLALGRRVKNREAEVLEIEFEAQVLRIKTDVRTAFYRLLIAQEKYQLAKKLYHTQQNAISKSSQLFEAGETPKTDLLQTELQAQKAMVLLSRFEVLQKNAWRELVAVAGQPGLSPQRITGSFESIAESITFDACQELILNNSPELQAAKAEVERVRSTVDQELANSIPDYQTQVSLGRDSNSNHFFTGIQLQIPLQICNRNQGNIAAAKARLVVAQNHVETIKLSLSKRLATEYQLYQSAFVKSDLYATKLLPIAQQTLDLLTTGYPEEVGFLRLVTAQQTVIDITIEYLDALDELWSSRLKIEGLLLDDSLGQ